MPDVMLEYALKAAEQYPNKRIIVHFSQPHCPFIGETGYEHYEVNKRAFWRDVMDSNVNTDHISEAYCENLEAVLPAVKSLMAEVEGKHVVTSDHGQALGENSSPIPMNEWGHPPGIYISEIVEVPWLEYQNGGRREIIEESPNAQTTSDVENDVIRDRLADLGYV